MIICPICKKEFNPKFKQKKYCSAECYSQYDKIYHKQYRKKYKTEIAKSAHIYWETHKKPSKIFKCQNPQCNKEFIPIINSQKYCSKKCGIPFMKEKHKIWIDKNRNKIENIRLMKEYKISFEEYIRLLKNQKGKCIICNKKSKRRLHVDHDHKTGKVRGLLCFRCNNGIGFFNDDIELLLRAIDYLKKVDFFVEEIK